MQIQKQEGTFSFSDEVLRISNQFLREAVQSPMLLSDMAAMEKYMAESYSGRTFAELLQNADDSGSTKICVLYIDGTLYVANNGRPFNTSDLISICRSGASKKQRGTTIGYRGVGFKSATSISNNILIRSSNTVFSFSKKFCAEKLHLPTESVPTVRIPFLVEDMETDQTDIIKWIESKGYTTIFVFPAAKIDSITAELDSLVESYFIFLNHISSCDIHVNNISKHFSVKREKEDGYSLVSLKSEKSQSAWQIKQNNGISIAFKWDGTRIVPCLSEESVYHCFLPTQDKTLFPIRINADFSTDPSRKHLTLDEQSSAMLKEAGLLLSKLTSEVFYTTPTASNARLLRILTKQISYSRPNQVFKGYYINVVGQISIPLSTGERIPIKEYKLLPNWLEQSEKELLRKRNPYVKHNSLSDTIYSTYEGVDDYIALYSSQNYISEDLSEILTSDADLLNYAEETYSKILAHYIQEEKRNEEIHHMPSSISHETISQCVIREGRKLALDPRIIEHFAGELSTGEVEWFSKKIGIQLSCKKSTISTNPYISTQVKSKAPIVARWRSSEQQVMQVEEFLGNHARDVSKRNLGYDIESTTPDGRHRYIEVKSMQGDMSSFSITNNEYTSAHQLGDEYYICLIFEDRAIYIQNPLQHLSFEKRIRQWEWFCEEYTGEEIKISHK